MGIRAATQRSEGREARAAEWIKLSLKKVPETQSSEGGEQGGAWGQREGSWRPQEEELWA